METKIEILERLLKKGEISLEEAFLLMQTEKEVVMQPYPVSPQPYQYYPAWWGIYPPVQPTYPMITSNGTDASCNPNFKFNGSVTLTGNTFQA